MAQELPGGRIGECFAALQVQGITASVHLKQEQKLSWMCRSRDPACPGEASQSFPGLRFKLPAPACSVCRFRSDLGKAEHGVTMTNPTDPCFARCAKRCWARPGISLLRAAEPSGLHSPRRIHRNLTQKIQVPPPHLSMKPHSTYIVLL